ncbi:hypothetical protein [Maribellus sediminis]|uniref:hypothetical protein n=1 Tax=Maribellus sediminis TaxID=2696285 RepID=UPI0014301893|nr:hypothetical protein [Maribellus sediminis]
MTMKVPKSSILILLFVSILTISPKIIIYLWPERFNYSLLIFLAGMTPILLTHMSSLGLRFKNYYFSGLWGLLILINGLMYNDVMDIWVLMLTSFLYYNALRLIFRLVNKEEPIPLQLRYGMTLSFNRNMKRKENKRDVLFSVLSFGFGLVIIMTKILK